MNNFPQQFTLLSMAIFAAVLLCKCQCLSHHLNERGDVLQVRGLLIRLVLRSFFVKC